MSQPSRREQLRLQQEAEKAKQKRINIIMGVGAAVLALILIGVLAVVITQNMAANQQQAANAITPANATANKDGLEVYPGKAKEGVPVVDLYVDYQCPACKGFEAAFGPTLAEMAQAGEIKLVNHTMSFMDNNLKNTASIRSANAAVCAAGVNKYAEYDKAVFPHQAEQEIVGMEGYSDALLRDEIPAQIGLTGADLTTFQNCYDNKLGEAYAKGVDKAAYEAGVTSTPTIRVNGKAVDNSALTSVDAFKTLIKEMGA